MYCLLHRHLRCFISLTVLSTFVFSAWGYAQNLQLDYVFNPQQGTELGGTKIVIKTNTILEPDDTNKLFCCFDDISVEANIIDLGAVESTVACVSPPNRPGAVLFWLSYNHECLVEKPQHRSKVQPSFSAATYEYTIMATLFSSSPSLGSNNTEIQIVGSGFRNTPELQCVFGLVVVPAQFISDSKLTCMTPSISNADNKKNPVPLAVSNNGVDLEGDWADIVFTYTEPVMISSIDPATAPMHGGAMLFVRGNNFEQKVACPSFCKIGDFIVNATILSNDEILCIVPALDGSIERRVPVAVAIDGGYNYHSDKSVFLTVHPLPVLLSVYPQSVPENGNSDIKVFGGNFIDSSHLACQFGSDTTVVAVWKSRSLLECKVPAIRSGETTVRVSTNGQNVGVTNSIPFFVSDALTLTSISPTMGPLGGGSFVQLCGTGFDTESVFLCRFGSVSVYPSFVNSTSAYCQVPSFDSFTKNQTSANVEVSANNGHDWTMQSHIYFTYISPFTVKHLEPTMGPVSGGTVLSIIGDFRGVDLVQMSCRFRYGTFTLLSNILSASNEEITCSSPPFGFISLEGGFKVAKVDIALTNDANIAFASNAVTFAVYPKLEVKNLSPSIGSELGGTNVTVFGSFSRSSIAACKFDNVPSPFAGLWVSKDIIVCSTPPARRSFLSSPLVEVSIALNGVDFENAAKFLYAGASHVANISPKFGPSSGGTLLAIRGEGFVVNNSQGALCSFGGVLTEARVTSSSLARCRTPSSMSNGPVRVKVTFDEGMHFIDSDSTFTYVIQPVITSVVPSYVSARESTTVRVYGEHFDTIGGGEIKISFGSIIIDGIYSNDGSISFRSPLVENTKSNYLRLSLNGQDFSPSGPIFSVLKPPMVVDISPPFSHEEGGIPITITGTDFVNIPHLSCIFHFDNADMTIGAKYLSPNVMECIAPELKSPCIGRVKVEVLYFAISSPDNPIFEVDYHSSIFMLSVYPPSLQSNIQTELNVTGLGFGQLGNDLYCQFYIDGPNDPKQFFAKADVKSNEVLQCLTPDFKDADIGAPLPSLDISIVAKYGQTFYQTAGVNSILRASIYDAIEVDKVIPSTASTSGDIAVDIYGKNFDASQELRCSFAFEDQRLETTAIYRSRSQISCDVPAISSQRGITLSNIRVSNNGHDYSNGLSFQHRNPFHLEEMHPKAVMEEGATNVTIFGMHFYRHNLLACRITGGSQVVTTKAWYISSKIVQCNFPTLKPGSYSVSIQSDFIHAVSDLKLDVYPSVEIHEVVPPLGPLSGGTRVLISGQNFLRETVISCEFDDQPVLAKVVSSREVHCWSPPAQYAYPHEIELRLVQNGQSLSPKAWRFTYVHRPQIDIVSPSSIRGKYLGHELGNTVARVGNLMARVDFVSDNGDYLEFSIPHDLEWESNLTIPVEVSTNGGSDYSLPGPQIEIIKQTSVASISPAFGLEIGGTKVSLSGHGFIPHPNATCRFGLIVVKAFVISPQNAECFSPPPKRPGPILLDFSNDGLDWTDHGYTFTYEIPFDVSRVEPQKIPSVGNILVHVYGSNFVAKDGIKCSFGDAGSRPASIVSEKEMTCVSPRSALEGLFHFDIIVGGTQMTLESIPLEFVSSPQLHIRPQYGKMDGETRISISTEEQYELEDKIDCIFDIQGIHYKTIAQVENRTTLTCLTPPFERKETGFVRANVGLYSSSSGFLFSDVDMKFTFKDMPTIAKVDPIVGDFAGSTAVAIAFEPNSGIFLNNDAAKCRFGPSLVDVHWISETEIVCLSPPAMSQHEVNLELTENGVDYILAAGSFMYMSPPLLDTISPWGGLISSRAEIHISLLHPFEVHEPSRIECCFRDVHGNHSIPGKVVNASTVLCPLPQFRQSGNVSIALSLNGQEFTESPLVYQVLDRVEISSIFPTSGIVGNMTTVRLQGGFPRLGTGWRCRLETGSLIPVGRVISISSNEIQCETVCPMHSPGTFSLVLEAPEFGISLHQPFICDTAFVMESVEPSILTTDTQHLLLIEGSGLRPGQYLSCMFTSEVGIHHSKGTFVDSRKFACPTPTFSREGTVQIAISTNGKDYGIESHTILKVIPVPIVTKVAPLRIVAGESIIIKGTFGQFGGKISCHIEGTSLPVKVVADGIVSCLTFPNIELGNHTIFVGIIGLGDGLLDGRRTLEIIGRPIVSSVTPIQGLRMQSQRVRVLGENFQAEESATCHFGSSSVAGEVISDSEIVCFSPESKESGHVQFKLQLGSIFVKGRRDWSFLFMNPWVIENIVPKAGCDQGGTDVNVFGRGFYEGIAVNCRFGELTVPATVLTETFLKCKTPRQEYPGYVDFELETQQSANMISFPGNILAYLPQFYVYPTLSIIQFYPLTGFSHGGAQIFISGTWPIIDNDILATYSPMCKFGSQIVQAFFTEEWLISCRAPSTFGVGPTTVDLSITLNGADYITSTGRFKYYEAVHIDAMSPGRGQINGGTRVSLVLAGRVPDEEVKISCRFGNFGETSGIIDSRRNAITCPTPSVKEATSVPVYLRLGASASWYDTGRRFVFDREIILNSVSPRTLDEDGGEVVYIHGEGFSSSAPFYCRFGKMQVKARRVSSETISCKSPPLSDVEVHGHDPFVLSVTSNLIDYIQVPELINFKPIAYIESVEPHGGPTSGGSLVKILGKGFQLDSSTLCWFGKYATAAKVLSTSTISCMSSPFYLSQGMMEKVAVRVSQGGGAMIPGLKKIAFGYFKLPLLSDWTMHPTLIPIDSTSEIKIGGIEISRLMQEMDRQYFSPDVKVRAHFFVLPAFLHGHQMILQIPTNSLLMPVKGVPIVHVPLEVSFNGGTDYSPGPILELYDNPVLISIYPPSIILGYHNDIVVEISNIHWFGQFNRSPSCRIGNIISIGEILSNTLVRCPVQIAISKFQPLIPVSISLNTEDFIHESLPLSILQPPEFFNTSSIPVSSSGNTVVMKGSNFESLEAGNVKAICVQFDVSIPPLCNEIETLNSRKIRFEAPPGKGMAKLQFLVNSHSFLDTGVELKYLEDIVLKTVHTSSAGDNDITLEVMGRNFDNLSEYSCVLSTEVTRAFNAQFSNLSDVLHCTIPRVHVVLNSQVQIFRHLDNFFSNGLQFFDSLMYTLESLDPKVVPEGQNEMVILGQFENKDAKYCQYYSSNGNHWKVPISTFSSRIVQCNTPINLSPGAARVFVSSKDNAYRSNMLPLSVRVRQIVVDVAPASAYISGGGLIHVTFDTDIEFPNESNEGLVCDFGGFQVHARVLESRMVICESPTFPEAIVVPFKVQQRSKDGRRSFPIHDNIENVYFTFIQAPVIAAVSPKIALFTGGTIVDIFGNNFSTVPEHNNVRLVSILDPSLTVKASVVKQSEVRLKVTLPSSPHGLVKVGSVHLEVSTNGVDFVRFAEPLRLVSPELQLDIVSPNIILEGTRLFMTIHGSNFGRSALEKSLLCQIGERHTKSVWLSSTSIQCESPNDLKPGRYSVAVIHGDLAVIHGDLKGVLSSNLLSITVSPKIFLNAAHPLFGGFKGGTVISLEGSNFLMAGTSIACSFEKKKVEMIVLNDTHAMCTSPTVEYTSTTSDTLEGLQVAFQLLLPEIDQAVDGSNKDLIYKYYPDESIIDISPRLLTISSTQNSFMIIGLGFLDTYELSCKVGKAAATEAVYISSSSVSCPVPPLISIFGSRENYLNAMDEGLAKSSVAVSNNGQFASQWTSIEFYEELLIDSKRQFAGAEGTPVKIRVENLPKVNIAFCAFGHVVVDAQVILPSYILCRCPAVPGASVPNQVEVLVSVNGDDFIHAGDFTYLDDPIPYSVEPAFNPVVGGDTVMVNGANFHENIPILCAFGELMTAAEFVQPGRISCIVPSQNNGTVELSVIPDHRRDVDVTGQYHPSVPFTYLEQMKLLKLIPSNGSILGNTPLKIIGERFTPLENLVCVFGDDSTSPAVLTGINEISCSTPEMRGVEEKHSEGISVGLKHSKGITVLSEMGVVFSYTLPHVVTDVNPKRGLVGGGESIMITGRDFYRPQSDDSVLCSFGGNVFKGRWKSESLIQCVTPALIPGNSLRTVQVIRLIDTTLNNNAWNDTFVVASFKNESTYALRCSLNAPEMRAALSLLPTIGDIIVESNGTEKSFGRVEKTFKITFTTLGNPVNAGPLPLFGVSILSPTNGFQASVEELRKACCDVQISTNGVDFFGGKKEIIPFTFDDDILVTEVDPHHGATTGGTVVKIRGAGISTPYAQSSLIYCIFGDQAVESKFLNVSTVECTSPPFPAPANVTVTLEVFAKAQGYGSRIESVGHFEYVASPTIVSTFPKTLSRPGSFGTAIDVFGEFFISSFSLRCRLRGVGNYKFFEKQLMKEFETDAVYNNASHIQCIIPNFDGRVEFWSTELSLAVTTNGVDWTNEQSIPILPPHEVTSIYPSSGPRSGGTKLLIEGKNFVESDTLACQVGQTIVKSHFVSDTGMICITPPLLGLNLTVQVRITINGKHFFAIDHILFDYYEDVVILGVDPMVAPSSGGTIVSLLLSPNLFHGIDYFCKFNETQVPAKIKDHQLVLCRAPPSHATGGLVSLEVSRNNVDFSASGIGFMYIPGQQSEKLEIIPTHGPKGGGTSVRMSGYSNITQISEWRLATPRCRFKDVVVDAIHMAKDDEYIVCKSPSAKDLGNIGLVAVDVSLTGAPEDFTSIGALFQYDDEISVAKVVPDMGSVQGGTPVRVIGGPFKKSFQDSFTCRFGNDSTSAKWKSETELSCSSPPLSNMYESQDITLFGMAWNQEVQSVELNVEDYTREIHTISTHGINHPKGETQVVQIEGKNDRYEIQRVTIGSEPSDSCRVDISFKQKERGFKTYKIITFVNDGHRLSGAFQILVRDALGQRVSDMLPHNISAEGMKEALVALSDAQISSLTLRNYAQTLDGTTEWTVAYAADAEVPSLLVNGNSLIGVDASIHVEESSQGFLPEIQRISVVSTHAVKGYFHVSFNGFQTVDIPWSTSAQDLKDALELLPSIGTVNVEQKHNLLDPISGKFKILWEVSFLSYEGDAPPLEPCCDSRNEIHRQSLFSDNPYDDALIMIEEVRKGQPDYDEETFQLSFSGFSNSVDITEAIAVNATELDVIEALSKVSVISRKSLGVQKFFTEEGNSYPRYIISFEPVVSHPILTASGHGSIQLKMSSLSRNDGVISVKQDIAIKEVQTIEYRISAGLISCKDGKDEEGSFSFHSTSSGETLKETMESLVGFGSQGSYYGKIEVTKVNISSSGTRMVIVFDTHVYDRPALICGSNVHVKTLVDGVERKVSGGSFQFTFGNETSKEILYNATASDVKNALEALEGIGEGAVEVSGEDESDGKSGPWIIAFKGSNMNGDLPSIQPTNEALMGHNPKVSVEEVEKGSFLTGTYRLKVKKLWTAPIYVNATARDIKISIEAIYFGSRVRVLNPEWDALGGVRFEVTFLHYVGHEPFGFIPSTAGDLPPLTLDHNKLSGCGFKVTIIVNENGTIPISTSEDLKGFRLLPPGISASYPLEKVTRWLKHNESSLDMKEALLLTGAYDFDIEVSREGPYSNGSYKWHVTYPQGKSSLGSSWTVVRNGGAAIRLLGDGANVSTSVTKSGTSKGAGSFRLYVSTEAQFDAEMTGDIPVNASATLIKGELEALPSIATVRVSSASLDKNMTGSNAKKWEITFTSMRNIGDMPNLAVDTLNLTGTGAKIMTKEVVKGSGNNVYVLKIPMGHYFQIRYMDEVSDLYHTNIDASILNAALDSLCGQRHSVEVHFDEILILPLSINNLDASILGVELYAPCGLDSNGYCFQKYFPAAIAYEGTTTPLGGTFSLSYNSPTGFGHLHTCSEQTNAISVHASAAILEMELEKLTLIEDVDVSLHENLSIGSQECGIVGVNRQFRIVFRKVGMCGANEFLHYDEKSKPDVPLFEVHETGMLGSKAYDPVTRKHFQHIVKRDMKGFDRVYGTTVSLRVSSNGHDYSRSKTGFVYSEQMGVDNIFPAHGFHKTAVLIIGNSFVRGPNLLCHFVDRTVFPELPIFHEFGVPVYNYINSTHIECTVPPAMKSRKVQVFVSVDGYLRKTNVQDVTFTYDVPITVHGAHPLSGPSRGNFSVIINGGAFQNSTDLNCRFGSEVVPATFVTSMQIQCLAPHRPSGIHRLSVSTNGQDFLSDIGAIHFYDEIKISELIPTSGPSTNAGTTVRIYGSSFFNSSVSICSFNNYHVPARFISSEEINCRSPPIVQRSQLNWKSLIEHKFHVSNEKFDSRIFEHAHGYPLYLSKLVEVKVSMNAQDFAPNSLNYIYQDDIVISGLSKTVGTFGGYTPIFIKGSGFVNTTALSCRFGEQQVPASFLTRNLIFCFTPPMSNAKFQNSFLQHKPGHFPGIHHLDYSPRLGPEMKTTIEVSNNGIDYTDSRHSFDFRSPAQNGFYQPGAEEATLMVCPRGAYCNGINHKNFTLCPKGTYQPKSGQESCHICDVGFMCPEDGLPVPRLCPAGYVCDVKGTKRAEQPCPQGFFCPAGTASTDTFCGYNRFNELSLGLTFAERTTTIAFGDQGMGSIPIMGGRETFCFDNSTDDYGLQASKYPARVWDELRSLPLDHMEITLPLRGRFCQQESCLEIDSSVDVMLNSDLDFSRIELQRPIPCPHGTYCHAGTSSNISQVGDFSTSQQCFGKNYCPEASSTPNNGECPKGFYCRFGKKHSCPVGTFCPDPGLWDPLPCRPGTFNFMVGQVECSDCPLGHFCVGYGRVDPALCTPGFVCSFKRLQSPNMRCPPGFYCPLGTQTSDPFRNDTALRPYPCRPGSYCPSGVGSDSIVEGNVTHSQPCSAGFYCESASTSAKGSGICPSSFVCPKGTATPIPTKKGHYARYPGTVKAAKCLPGFYSPTIESSECVPCPPGTSCEDEGHFIADLCPPGTYRGSLGIDGVPCISCPQGTWSKNWNLRDEDECIKCAAGVVCGADGMTTPCSKTDLPRPFEPVVNVNGIPFPAYNFRHDRRPTPFSVDQCLKLNAGIDSKRKESNEQNYFFGELIPPYIDVLGRGAHLRVTDEVSAKYGKGARCYRNSQMKGSMVFERFVTYFGPQYDIQTGYPHQGYGSGVYTQRLLDIPRLEGSQTGFQYYFTKGMTYIPLVRAPRFDPTFNCTPGFSLMNSTLVETGKQVVYTSADYDYEGGVDVERCSRFDSELQCYIDPSFQLHDAGDCCNLDPWTPRSIFLARDQYYPGTCEADNICSSDDDEETEAIPCREGFICDEQTNSTLGTSTECPAGYICDFGTTPDSSLESPQSKYKTICPAGRFCPNGTGISAHDNLCPLGYFCPAGTSNATQGKLANDALNRHLDNELVDSFKGVDHVRYLGQDSFHLLIKHDSDCIDGEEVSLSSRYFNADVYLNVTQRANVKVVNKANGKRSKCARDKKWMHVINAIKRKECDCNPELLTILAIGRFLTVSLLMPLLLHSISLW